MRRTVFEPVAASGFDLTGVEACAVTKGSQQRGGGGRRRLYAGTGDGALTSFECRADTSEAIRSGAYELVPSDALRKFSSRDKKPVTQLEVFEGQNLLLALVDGVVVAYDTVAGRATAHIRDARGSIFFAAHAPSRTLVIFQKKKARVFQWQPRGGALRDREIEIDLQETPTTALLVSAEVCVLAMRREFGELSLVVEEASTALATTTKKSLGAAASGVSGSFRGALGLKGEGPRENPRKLLDAPGGAGVLLTIAGSLSAPLAERLLASTGGRGSVLKLPLASEQQQDVERLSWSAGSPRECKRVSAFIVALIGTSTVEVHFAPSLAPLQVIELNGPLMTRLCVPAEEQDEEVVFALGDSTASVLRMAPVDRQVASLLESSQYEDALALCALTKAGSKNEAEIQERYAYALYTRGDFEGAAQHWILAETRPEDVARLFEALQPPDFLQLPSNDDDDSATTPEKRLALEHPPKLQGSSLARAAASLALYYQAARTKYGLEEQTSEEEKKKRRTALIPIVACSPDRARLIDTSLLAALLQCSPPRLFEVVSLLRSNNQACELGSCAPLLAAGGANYAEALLWLYRSKGAHQRALSLLVEDRCVVAGGWDRATFRRWKARYLRWLWFDDDSRNAQLVLGAAPFFAVTPSLALAALCGSEIISTATGDPDDERDLNRKPVGGAGLSSQDVVTWLKQLEISSDETWKAPPYEGPGGGGKPPEVKELKLNSGSAVAVAYLEFLIFGRDENLAVLHNELGFLLLDMDDRARLRRFLASSKKYQAAALLAKLPPDFVLEKALVLARLGKHSEVLEVYVNELKGETALAEKYCASVWEAADKKRSDLAALKRGGADVEEDDDDGLSVYLTLAKCHFAHDDEKIAYDLLTRNLGRFDPIVCLKSVVPKEATLLTKGEAAEFVAKVVRFWEAAKRTSDIEHQLLRVEFVNLKYKLTKQQLKQQAKMSAIPELAKLGKLKKSLPPVILSAEDAVYRVGCTRHIFEENVVLQFHVTNDATRKDQKLQNVRVRVQSQGGDADLYTQDAEVPLRSLPCRASGSCYVVLRTYPTVGAVSTTMSCELRFSVLSDADSSYLEEIQLKDITLNTADYC